jgi:ribA/ribD-fused uncharacterized protein
MIINNFHAPGCEFLSNFFPAEVEFERMKFPSVEFAYVAAKTTNRKLRWELLDTCKTSGQAKRFGRKLEIRSDWEEVKLGIMEELLRQKFSIPELRAALASTGSARIVEGNRWHDNFWGDCMCPKCATREGQNHLGKLLMKIRADI